MLANALCDAGRAKDESLVEAIAAHLEHPDAHVRGAALSSLVYWMENGDYFDRAVRMIGDPDLDVRRDAIYSVGRMARARGGAYRDRAEAVLVEAKIQNTRPSLSASARPRRRCRYGAEIETATAIGPVGAKKEPGVRCAYEVDGKTIDAIRPTGRSSDAVPIDGHPEPRRVSGRHAEDASTLLFSSLLFRPPEIAAQTVHQPFPVDGCPEPTLAACMNPTFAPSGCGRIRIADGLEDPFWLCRQPGACMAPLLPTECGPYLETACAIPSRAGSTFACLRPREARAAQEARAS